MTAFDRPAYSPIIMVKAMATPETTIEAAAPVKSGGKSRISRKPKSSPTVLLSSQPPDSSPVSSALKSFGRFTYCTMRRSQIHFAAYNPRTIDPSARRRLRAAIKHHGLVEPLVVNQRTDFTIIGGHQRTMVMDELAGFDPSAPLANDYEIPVALVDIPLAEEQALNISLNNAEIQGNYDLGMLEELLAQPEFPVAATGFDRAALQMMLSPEALATIFGEESPGVQQALAEAPIIETLNEMHAAGLEADREQRQQQRAAEGERANSTTAPATAATPQQPASPAAGSSASSPADDPAAIRDALIARRQAYIERSRDNNDADFHCTLIFDNSAQLDRFLSALGLDQSQRYHDGPAVARLVGVDVEGDVVGDEGQADNEGEADE